MASSDQGCSLLVQRSPNSQDPVAVAPLAAVNNSLKVC